MSRYTFILVTESKIKQYVIIIQMYLLHVVKLFLFRHMDQAVILLFWQATLNVCRSSLVLNMATSKSVVWSALTNMDE